MISPSLQHFIKFPTHWTIFSCLKLSIKFLENMFSNFTPLRTFNLSWFVTSISFFFGFDFVSIRYSSTTVKRKQPKILCSWWVVTNISNNRTKHLNLLSFSLIGIVKLVIFGTSSVSSSASTTSKMTS